jgi:hypothetical protein
MLTSWSGTTEQTYVHFFQLVLGYALCMGMKIDAPATLEDFVFSMLSQDDDEKVTCLKSFLEQENRLLHETPIAVLEREESEAEDEQDPSEAKYAMPFEYEVMYKVPTKLDGSQDMVILPEHSAGNGEHGQDLTIMVEETLRQLVQVLLRRRK